MHVQEHPNTATYLGNLAQLEMALGKPQAAEPQLRRALEISIKVGAVCCVRWRLCLTCYRCASCLHRESAAAPGTTLHTHYT